MQGRNTGVKITKTKNEFATEKEWNPLGWPVYLSDDFDDRDGYGYCLVAYEDGPKQIQVVLTEDFLVEALAEIRDRFYHLPDLQLGVKATVEEEIPWPDHATLSVDEESWPDKAQNTYLGMPTYGLQSNEQELSDRCPTCGPNCCG